MSVQIMTWVYLLWLCFCVLCYHLTYKGEISNGEKSLNGFW